MVEPKNKRGIGILKDINLLMEQNSLNQWKPFTFGVVILKDEFVAKRIGDLQRAVPIF